MRTPALAAALLLTSLAACSNVERVQLTPYLLEHEIQLTEGNAPDEAQAVSLIATETTGWYFLGMFPLVRADIEVCLELLIEEAKAVDADGISNLRVTYEPARALNILSFGLPDWTAQITLTGMAYQLPHAAPPQVYRNAMPPR